MPSRKHLLKSKSTTIECTVTASGHHPFTRRAYSRFDFPFNLRQASSRDDLKTSRGPDRAKKLEGEPSASASGSSSSERECEAQGGANGSSGGGIKGNGDNHNAAQAAVASTSGRGATNGGTIDAAPGALPRRGRQHQRAEGQDGKAREGAAAAVATGGSSAGALVASKKLAPGITVVSVTTLRRMCYFPGPILRSGLVFQRVTALSLPGQGIRDGDIPRSVVGLAGLLRKVDVSRNRLTAVPQGILDLGSALQELNLGNNQITDLPPEIANLNGMLFLNLAGNRLKRIPPEIGRLSALRRLGLKGNALVGLPSSIGDLSHLVELYLTGNILEALPSEIVKLRRLKKLQMSFNNLRSLPIGMEGMRSLELCRIAVNPGLAEVPEGLAFAERLSWVSLGGTAWCARAAEKRRRSSFPIISREQVVLGERLGSGASGDVYAAVYRGKDVAVKVFKAEVSPDGHARDELDVACAVNHPNLTKAIGIVRVKNSRGSSGGAGAASDDCSINNKQWLVMERVEGQPLADKPDFTSVLRCRWGAGRRFEPVLVLAVLLQVARAMSYLHEKSICHGDLYAHNVLVDGKTGATVLCDFGASFFYQNFSERHDRDGCALEGTEVRAFGIMARDMACRSVGCEWILQDLVPSCFQADTARRPSFHEIINQLHAELMQSIEPSSPMVTSAKSLHSLLDRPDIAAERGRIMSAERDQELLSQSSGESSSTETMVSGCKGSESAAAAVAAQVGAIGGGVNAPGMEDTIVSEKSGAAGERGRGMVGGSGRRGRGSMSGSKPVCRLGGVQEGTADDEAGEEEEKAQEKGGKAEGKGLVTFK